MRQQIYTALVSTLISLGTLVGWEVGKGFRPNETPGPSEKISTSLKAYFSPKGGCEDEVVRLIDSSCSRVICLAYGFTSKPILEALVRAHERGVIVWVVVDKDQPLGTLAGRLKNAGVDVVYDGKHAIFHNKVFIIDEEVLITGSYNWTQSAELRNAENMLVIKHPPVELLKAYEQNAIEHREHSH